MSTIRIAVLECDTPFRAIRERYDTYGKTFTDLFDKTSQELPEEPVKLSFESFHVYKTGSFPEPDAVDALLLTGSQYNSFDNDAWILDLVQFVQRFHKLGKPMVGICFGHQIIARAMGAEVARNPNGREISVCDVSLAGPGRQLFGQEKLSLNQSHQDAVLSVPDGFENLGSSPSCPIQGLYQDSRVLTLQGHPEFTEYIMERLLDAKREQGLLANEVFDDGAKRKGNAQDGLLVGTVISKFLMGTIAH